MLTEKVFMLFLQVEFYILISSGDGYLYVVSFRSLHSQSVLLVPQDQNLNVIFLASILVAE